MTAQLTCDWDPQYWRVNLHTLAMWVSKDAWIAWPYMRKLSKVIQAKVLKGGARIILNMPPRHGKSTLVSEWLPTWFLHWFPYKRVLLGSYEAGFASDWGLAVLEKFKDEHSELISKVKSNRRASHDWRLEEGGGMSTAGIDGAFTGKGGDLLILDDPHKNYEDAMSPAKLKKLRNFFEKTFMTRAEPGASVIVVMTRWHDNDFTQHLLDEWPEENWTHINIPALAEEGVVDPLGREPGEALCPARYTREDLLKTKRSKPHTFNGMFQGNPVPIEGAIWRFPWLEYWDEIPIDVDLWVQSWDCNFKESTKSKSSFVVGQVWAICGADRYLVHQVRGRWGFTETCAQMEAMSKAYPQAFLKLVEDKANGSAIMDHLKLLGGFQPINPTDSKLARAISVSGEFSTGHVYIPLPHTQDWVTDYINEVTRFPLAKNDDQVDATSQVLHYAKVEVSNVWTATLGKKRDGKGNGYHKRKEPRIVGSIHGFVPQ